MNEEIEISKEEIDLKLNIYPVKNHGVPAIEISCLVQDNQRIEQIIKKALENEALIAEIELRNKWKAIPKLTKLGIINPRIFDELELKQ